MPNLGDLYQFPIVRKAVHAVGPAFWRLPSVIRSRLCPESKVASLTGTRLWRFGKRENVTPRIPVWSNADPTLGHRIAARPYRVPQPFVAELDQAWLVGRHATPITRSGRILMTSFRDQPKMMTLEPQADLVEWVTSKSWEQQRPPDMAHVSSFVNRLDPNYFHWIVEWCGQIEGLHHYREQTGISPKILVRADGPPYIRASLELLGFSAGDILEWVPGQEAQLVDKLVVPSLPGIRVACSPRNLAWLRARFLAAASVDSDGTQADRKIYIPRKPGGWRSVLNEEEVMDALTKAGFEVLRPEKLSLVEQIRLFASASLIVGLHGSGLTNVLFAPHASVLEMVGSYGDGVFYSIATGFEQPYTLLNCQAVNDDVVVNIEKLLRMVNRV